MIKPRKSLGQNFLTDQNIVRKIIDTFNTFPCDIILEIGPGTGALTDYLIKNDVLLYAVELDNRALELLSEKYPHNRYPKFNLIESDILDIDLQNIIPNISEKNKINIIGNIPYNISSDIFFWLFHQKNLINKAQLMIQKEVGQRLTARPGTKAYGILTVAMELAGACRYLFDVSPNCFYPVPKVKSSIIEMTFNTDYNENDFSKVLVIVKAAFNQRRKTLRNSLSNYFNSYGEKREIIISSIESVMPGLFSKRPEQLSTSDFVQIFRICSTIQP
jgi:16S rRNA (adenine1518-N6/adenine1519-N6)-dimethyltransferase